MTLTEPAHARLSLDLFAVRMIIERDAVVVVLRGEADVFTLPEVLTTVAGAICDHDGPVVVDLAETSFVDIRTLHALSSAADVLTARGRALTVRAPLPVTARLLALVGRSQLIEADLITAA